MKLYWNKTAKNRAALFRSICVAIINDFQKDRWPSCEEIIMREIDASILQGESDFTLLSSDYNYDKLALTAVKNVAFYLISSGNYNVYPGVMNPVGLQLIEVCKQAAYLALNRGYLENKDYTAFINAVEESSTKMG